LNKHHLLFTAMKSDPFGLDYPDIYFSDIKCYLAHIGDFFQFTIPTEFVLINTNINPASFKMGRVYKCQLWLHEDMFFTYKELLKLPDFHGTSHYPQIFAIEDWRDHGEDGHVHFAFSGQYIILSSDKFDDYIERRFKGYRYY